jgi:hypothetical protein
MKRRRLLLILSGCIASITLAFLVWPCEREPEYAGVRLSEWLERYARTHSKNSDLAAASKAIDAI